MSSDSKGETPNIETIVARLRKERLRSDRGRYLACLGFATWFFIMGSLAGGEVRAFLHNISAGFYAAGLIYWLVERDHQKRTAQLDTIDEMGSYVLRLDQVTKSCTARHRTIEKSQQRIRLFQDKARGLGDRERLKYEYLAWQTQMQLLYEFGVLRQEILERIDVVQKFKSILIEIQMSNEATRFEYPLLSLRQELQQLETAEKTMQEAVIETTVNFHERFIGSEVRSDKTAPNLIGSDSDADT